MAEADDGSVLFWRGSNDGPESFFEGVLADIQGGCQVFDPDDTLVLPDQMKGIADKCVGFIAGQVLQEEGLYNSDPLFVVSCSGETFQRLVQVSCIEQIFGRDVLFEQFMSGYPGKSVDTARGKNDQEVGGMPAISELPDGSSQTSECGAGKRQYFVTFHPHYPACIPECHDHGCIRYGFTAGVLVAFDNEELPDKRQQDGRRLEAFDFHVC